MKTHHKELIRTFKEVLSAESYQRQKIITYFNAKYTTTLPVHNTNSIKKTIGVIFENFFDNYGKFTPHILIQSEDVVKQMNFDSDTRIDSNFNNIEESGDISTASLNLDTNHQYINLGYNSIDRTGRYKIGLWE